MAYMKPLVQLCETCDEIATVEVFNKYGRHGTYCQKHGTEIVNTINRTEADAAETDSGRT